MPVSRWDSNNGQGQATTTRYADIWEATHRRIDCQRTRADERAAPENLGAGRVVRPRVRVSECPSIRAIRPLYLLSPSMCVPPTRVPSTRAEQKRTPNAEGEAQGFGHGNRPHSLVKKARRTR